MEYKVLLNSDEILKINNLVFDKIFRLKSKINETDNLEICELLKDEEKRLNKIYDHLNSYLKEE